MNVENAHSEDGCVELLGRFLLDPAELLDALAPEGWERSPLVGIFHPSAEQVQAERRAVRENLASLLGRSGQEDELPEEFGLQRVTRPLEPEREVLDLVGCALWDVFSNNHTVVDGAGRAYELGTWRASAAIIAETMNRRYVESEARYDYLEFYMGTAFLGRRADLRPVYRWIFARLKEAECDWIYSFPRLHLVDLGSREEPEDALAYDPSRAVQAELDRAERERETWAFEQELESAYREAVEDARRRPLPAAVAAYRDVYGKLPVGWPHPDMW